MTIEATPAGGTGPTPRHRAPARALATLCGVEGWERFSFYGMQGVLLLYLYHSVGSGGLGLSQSTATGIVGAYGSAVYLSTIAGAWLADRVVGKERVLFGSAVLIMLGHLSLAGVPGRAGLALGLAAVATGSGALKANTTAVIGGLYRDDDVGRDAGFALFYLGVNIGSLFGPLLTGVLQVTWGFHAAFGAAAVGMALGLAQYTRGRRAFAAAFRSPPNPLSLRGRMVMAGAALLGVALVAELVRTGILTAANLNDVVLWVVVGSTVALFTVLLGSPRVTARERRRVRGFVPMFLASTAFWALSQQQFTVLTVYADQQLNRSLFGWQLPVAWIQSINPVFIVALSAVFAAGWTRLGDRQPSRPVKFALSNLIMGAAFLLFVPLASTRPNSVPLLPVVGILLLFSVAELLLSPVGLSVATAAAPRAYGSQMVALFYLSIALGTSLSGVLAGVYSTAHQVGYFTVLGLCSVLIGLALLAAARRTTTALAPSTHDTGGTWS
jgi:POT family proton-dependent oligopeptide transporter